MARKFKIDNLDNLIQMYQSGVSLNKLSNQTGIPRITLNRHFRKKGIVMRTQSDSEKLKWSQMTPKQRKNQVQKAHDAVRGTKHSRETKIKAAKTFYQKSLRIGLFETEISEILSDFFPMVQQYPIDIYNIDIAIPELSIAIEIQSNNRSKLRNMFNNKRTKYLTENGFFVIYVISVSGNPKSSFNVFRVAHKIISLIDASRFDKSFFGKYVMIGSDGYPFTSSRYNFNHITRIE
ncbi:MAG: hypothetical protein GWP06_02260 [Actinobacteria bacterium]|nr:hypothetical protein [Actinomycetota bacterium]